MVCQALPNLPEAKSLVLPDWTNFGWADTIAERGGEVLNALTGFLSHCGYDGEVPQLLSSEGEFAGISYRIQGSGPPLVLIPLALSPSQWEPILGQLGQRYCTIVLGGPHLGGVAPLENRAGGMYRTPRRNLVDELELQPGETILDVGCGSGVHDRWLARYTKGNNPITALDINSYLLREARFLASREGLDGAIDFRQGNAESLPFEDSSFDATMSITVMEEVDADKMLSEMVRVTKPGGRVGVVVRSVDLPPIINLALRSELRARLEAPGATAGGLDEKGCGDFSLYRRFNERGLANLKMLPIFGSTSDPIHLRRQEENIVGSLSAAEMEEWRTAVAEGESQGAFFIARPFHCAVGTKP
ncbi:MAG: class I SAM-dependent methyltransferase [Dehalococcoidia bacterium]